MSHVSMVRDLVSCAMPANDSGCSQRRPRVEVDALVFQNLTLQALPLDPETARRSRQADVEPLLRSLAWSDEGPLISFGGNHAESSEAIADPDPSVLKASENLLTCLILCKCLPLSIRKMHTVMLD